MTFPLISMVDIAPYDAFDEALHQRVEALVEWLLEPDEKAFPGLF